MNLDQSGWDIDLLHDIFEDRDIQLILSIPLNTTYEDVWYWNREKMGQYTIKSAYAVIQEDRIVDQQVDTEWWKRMWNLQVPLRVKHFMWRATRDVLPTKDQLLTKRVPVLEFCPICNEGKESIYHLLVTCPFAKLCWNELKIVVNSEDHRCFTSWISAVSKHYSTHLYREIIMTCWMI